MGLKGYRLWVMGQLDSNLQSPTAPPPPASLASVTAVVSVDPSTA
jgi:hypothetical protein